MGVDNEGEDMATGQYTLQACIFIMGPVISYGIFKRLSHVYF